MFMFDPFFLTRVFNPMLACDSLSFLLEASFYVGLFNSGFGGRFLEFESARLTLLAASEDRMLAAELFLDV